MHEPVRVEKSRISRTTVFWLAILVLVNLAVGLFLHRPSREPAKPPPAQLGRDLRLISELSETERAEKEAATETAIGTQTPTLSDSLVCRVWGPYSNQDDLDALRAELEDVGSALEVRASEVAADPDYLVFIETGNNLETARRTLQELESQSVDAYIIAGGPYMNSVSVGVFSREERALAQEKRVEALGYQASTEALSRSQTVYHLVARVPERYAATADGALECGAIASVP
jgi:hypothetical protein